MLCDSTWRASTLIHRFLVAGQTIAWAIGAIVIRFVLGRPGGLLDSGAAGLLAWLGYLLSGSGMCFAAGVAASSRCTRSQECKAIRWPSLAPSIER